MIGENTYYMSKGLSLRQDLLSEKPGATALHLYALLRRAAHVPASHATQVLAQGKQGKVGCLSFYALQAHANLFGQEWQLM